MSENNDLGSCMAMIKEAIEQLGESMDATPPMFYPEAISNLCSKRNRKIHALREMLGEDRMRKEKEWYEKEMRKSILATDGSEDDPIPECTCEKCKDEPVCPCAWDLYNHSGSCLMEK